MKNKNFLLLSISLIIGVISMAQVTVTGTVTDAEDNSPLPGVTVLIKNTTRGTVTDIDGKYKIEIDSMGQVLVFQFVGMQPQEKPANSTSIDVGLSAGVELEDVVVTALGVKKEDKAIGYAIQEVSGEDAKQAGNANAISSLQGKVAGVQITTSSGSPGAAAKIQIRGASSASGSDPLIVVDGIPIDNTTRGSGVDGVDQSNRAVDINPDDIESVSVLKGAAATAVWGSRAQNGVIIYTTKKGKAGELTGNATMSVGVDMVRNLQKMQNRYGQTPDGVDAWGPELNGSTYTNADGSVVYAGNAHDNAKDFYNTGIIQNYALSLAGGGEKANTRASVGYFDQQGVIPGSSFNRLSVRSNTTAQLTKALSLTVNANIINSKAQRTQRGSNLSGVTLALYRTPANYNVKEAYEQSGGQNVNFHPAYDNPFWSTDNLKYDENVMRFIGATKLSYDLTKVTDVNLDALAIRYELAADIINENSKNYTLKKGSNNATFANGYIDDFRRNIHEFNQNFFVNGAKNWTDVTFDFLAGANLRSNKYDLIGVTAQDFAMDNYFNIANGLTTKPYQETEELYNPAILFDMSVGYKSMLFLNVNGRNEWSSALPYNDQNKSGYFYPGVSGSFVFTSAGERDYGALSFGKIRMGWGQTGLMPNAYSGRNTYVKSQGVWDPTIGYIPSVDPNGVPLFSTSTTYQDPNITPERTNEIEFGTDLRFWEGRLNVEATYYDRLTKGGLYFIPVHPSTGYNQMYTNATDIRNYGFELIISSDVMKRENFVWNVMLNTTINRNRVEKINSDIKEFGEMGFSNSVQNFLVEGEPFLVQYGTTWLRDGNGQLLLQENANGEFLPVVDGSAKRKIGDPNPDAIFGLNNVFTIHQNFTIAVLTDMRIGGDIWNGTYGRMIQLGTAELTEDRTGTVDINGVDRNTGQSITSTVSKETYYKSVLGNGANEEQIEKDVNWFKIRQVSFSYNQKLKGESNFIKNITYTLAGSNLFTFTNYSSGDPETALSAVSGAGGNSAGLDYFNNPNTRQILGSIKINF